jgi:hypothetical protein
MWLARLAPSGAANGEGVLSIANQTDGKPTFQKLAFFVVTVVVGDIPVHTEDLWVCNVTAIAQVLVGIGEVWGSWRWHYGWRVSRTVLQLKRTLPLPSSSIPTGGSHRP